MSRCRRETPAQVASQAVIHNEGQRNSGDGLSATDLRQSLRIASIGSLAVIQRCLRTPESRHVRLGFEVMMDERDRRGKRAVCCPVPLRTRRAGRPSVRGWRMGQSRQGAWSETETVAPIQGTSVFALAPIKTEALRLRSRRQLLLFNGCVRMMPLHNDATPPAVPLVGFFGRWCAGEKPQLHVVVAIRYRARSITRHGESWRSPPDGV
jgi:hypothetical protein